MDRTELAALHAALAVVLAWPDSVRAEVARWLSPAAPQPGNGLDPHPPPVAPMDAAANAAPDRKDASKTKGAGNGAAANAAPGSRRSPIPYAGKARSGKSPPSAAFAEQRLLTAMQEHSGASVDALAKAAGSSRSATGERLRQMALRGAVEKDITGRWKLKSEELRPPDPLQPSPS